MVGWPISFINAGIVLPWVLKVWKRVGYIHAIHQIVCVKASAYSLPAESWVLGFRLVFHVIADSNVKNKRETKKFQFFFYFYFLCLFILLRYYVSTLLYYYITILLHCYITTKLLPYYVTNITLFTVTIPFGLINSSTTNWLVLRAILWCDIVVTHYFLVIQ